VPATTVQLIIEAQDKATKELSRISGEVSKFSGNFGTEMKILKAGATAALVGITAVATGIVAFGVSSVKAYANAQSSQARFAHALQAIAKASDEQIASLRRQQNALALVTRFEDDAIASAQAFLASFALTSKQIEIVTPRLLDMAEGLRDSTGATIGLEGASNMLGKALQLGTVGMLAKAGVTIPGTTKAMQDLFKATFEHANLQKRVAMLAELVDGNFKGQAITAGDTLAGQIDILSNSYENLKEDIGAALADAFSPFVGAIQKYIQSDQLKKHVEDIIKKIHDWTDSIGGEQGIYRIMESFLSKLEKDVIPAIISFSKALITVSSFLLENINWIWKAVLGYEAFKLGLTIGLIPSLVLVGAAMIALAVGAFFKMQNSLNDLRDSTAGLKDHIGKMQDKANSMDLGPARDKLQGLINDEKRAADESEQFANRYSGLKGVFIAVWDTYIEYWVKAHNFSEKMSGKMHDIFKGIGDYVSSAFSGFGDAIWNNLKPAIDIINKMIAGYNDLPNTPNISEIRRQYGGSVSSGMPITVGENGAEMFVPSQSGNIRNASQMGSSEINININNPVVRDEADITKIVDALKRALAREQFFKIRGIRA
jgi:hypothetical protein